MVDRNARRASRLTVHGPPDGVSLALPKAAQLGNVAPSETVSVERVASKAACAAGCSSPFLRLLAAHPESKLIYDERPYMAGVSHGCMHAAGR